MFLILIVLLIFVVILVSFLYPFLVSIFGFELNVKKRYGENAKVFVSGGSSGIGKEIVKKLLKQNVKVISVSLETVICENKEESELFNEKKQNGQFIEFIADFSKKEETL